MENTQSHTNRRDRVRGQARQRSHQDQFNFLFDQMGKAQADLTAIDTCEGLYATMKADDRLDIRASVIQEINQIREKMKLLTPILNPGS